MPRLAPVTGNRSVDSLCVHRPILGVHRLREKSDRRSRGGSTAATRLDQTMDSLDHGGRAAGWGDPLAPASPRRTGGPRVAGSQWPSSGIRGGPGALRRAGRASRGRRRDGRAPDGRSRGGTGSAISPGRRGR
jgi:hypothetical protein